MITACEWIVYMNTNSDYTLLPMIIGRFVMFIWNLENMVIYEITHTHIVLYIYAV